MFVSIFRLPAFGGVWNAGPRSQTRFVIFSMRKDDVQFRADFSMNVFFEVKLLHENFSSRAVKRYLRSQDCTFWKDKKAGPYEHSVEFILQAGSHQSPVQLSRA